MKSSEKVNCSADGSRKPNQMGDISDGLRILARLIARHHSAKLKSTEEEGHEAKQGTSE